VLIRLLLCLAKWFQFTILVITYYFSVQASLQDWRFFFDPCRLNNFNNNNFTLLGSPGVCNCPAYSSLPRAQCPYSLAVVLRAFDPLSEIGGISVIGCGCYGRNAKEYSSLVSKSAEQRCPLLDRGIRQGKYPSISLPSFVDLAWYGRASTVGIRSLGRIDDISSTV